MLFKKFNVLLALLLSSTMLYAESVTTSGNTANSAKVERTSDSMKIILSNAPSVMSSEYSFAEGGTFAKSMKNATNMFGKDGYAKKMTRAYKNKNENKMVLSFPRIEYGFSGTVNEVCIKFHGSRKHFAAVHLLKDGTQKCIGKLNVKKYTPFLLEGSFSGGLSNLKFKPKYGRPNPFVKNSNVPINLPAVTGSVSGNFFIVSPWRGDDKGSSHKDNFNKESFKKSFEDDMVGMAAKFGMTEEMNKALEQVRKNQENSEGSSNDIKEEKWDCSCQHVDTKIPAHQIFCAKKFEKCKKEEKAKQELFQQMPKEVQEMMEKMKDLGIKY